MASHVLAWSCTVCHQIFLTQEQAAVHHLTCKEQVDSGSQHVALGHPTDGSVSVVIEDPMPVDVKEEFVLEMDYNNQVVTTSSVDNYISLEQPIYEVVDMGQAVVAEETTPAEPVSQYDSQLNTAIQSISGIAVTPTASPVKAEKRRKTTIKLCRASQGEEEDLETIDPSVISMSTTNKHPVPVKKEKPASPGKPDASGPPYVCKVCAQTFESRTVLDMHWKSEHYIMSKSYRWKCTSCARTFRKQEEFVKHEEAHAAGRMVHWCEKCDFAYSIELGLKAHLKTVHAVKDKICPICKKGFSHQGYLNNHMISHSNAKPHVCNVCGQFFKTGYMLGFHRRLHIDEKCAHCDLMFTWKPSYERHILTHTRKKQLECRTCGKIFCRLQQFKSHTEICEKKEHKPKLCRLCGKYFSDYHEYRKHKEQHPKPTIECDVCGKCFYTESNLDKHMIVHSQNAKFECKRCCVKFKYKDSLRQHIQSRGHKMGKSFVCPICERGFYSVQILNLHMKVHIRKTCKLCGEISLGAAGHQKHRQEAHPDGGRNLECTTCSLKFPSLQMLADHEEYYCEGKKWEPEDKESGKPDAPGSEMPAGDDDSENVVIPKEKVVSKEKRTAPAELMCTYCGSTFSAFQNLKAHMRYDHDVPCIYKCRLCKKYFEKRELLEDHVADVHDPSKKKVAKNENTGAIQSVIEKVLSADSASCVYTCDYCGKEFDEKSKMEGHVLTCTMLESIQGPSLAKFYKIDKGKRKGEFIYECINCEKKFDKRTTVEEHVSGCLLEGKQTTSEVANSPLVATGFKLDASGNKLNTTWSRVNTPWTSPSAAEQEAYDGYNKIMRRHVLIDSKNEDTVETIYATYSTQPVSVTAASGGAGPEKLPAVKPGEGDTSKKTVESESGEQATEPEVTIKPPKLVYFRKQFYDPIALMERWEGYHFTASDFLISDDEFDPEMIAEDEKLFADWAKEKEEQGLKYPKHAERRRKKLLGEELTPGRIGRPPGSKGKNPKGPRKRVRIRKGRAKAKEVTAEISEGEESGSDFSESEAAVENMLTDMGTQSDVSIQKDQPVKSTHVVIEKAANPKSAAGAVLKDSNEKSISLQTPSPVFAAGGKTLNLTVPNSGSGTKNVPTFTLTLSGIKPGTNQLHGIISIVPPKTPTNGAQPGNTTTPNVNAKTTVINFDKLKGTASLKNSSVSSTQGTPANSSAQKFPTALSAGIQVSPIAALNAPTKRSTAASNAEALRNVIRSGRLPNNGLSKGAKVSTDDETCIDSDALSEAEYIIGAATKPQAKRGRGRPRKDQGKRGRGRPRKNASGKGYHEWTPPALSTPKLSAASAEKYVSSALTNPTSATKRKADSPLNSAEASSTKKGLEIVRPSSSGPGKRRRVEIRRTKSGRRSVPKFRFDEEFVSGDELDDDEDEEDDFVGAGGQDDDDGYSGGSGFGDDDDDDDDIEVPSDFDIDCDDDDDGDAGTPVASGTLDNQQSQAQVQTPTGSGIHTSTLQNLSGIKKLQITSKLGQPNLTNVSVEYKSDPKLPIVADQPSDAFFKPKERLSHQVRKKILASTSVKEVLGMLTGRKAVEDSNREVASPGSGVVNKSVASKEQGVSAGVQNKVAAPKVNEITSKDGKTKEDLTNVRSPKSMTGASVQNKVAAPKVNEITSKDGKTKVDLTNVGSPKSTVSASVQNKVAAGKVSENTSKDGKKEDLMNVGSPKSTAGASVQNKVANENTAKDGNGREKSLNIGSPDTSSRSIVRSVLNLSPDKLTSKVNSNCRTCTICGSIFESLVEFMKHTTSHFTGTKWQCLYCSQLIHCDFLTHLGHHMMCWRTGRLKNKFKCPHCETLTADNVLFEAHIRNHARLGQMFARDISGDNTAGVDGDGDDDDDDEVVDDVGLEENDDDEDQDVEKAAEVSPAGKLTKTDKIPIVLLEKLDLMEKPGQVTEKNPAARKDDKSSSTVAATTDTVSTTADSVSVSTDAVSVSASAVSDDARADSSASRNDSSETAPDGEEVGGKRCGRPKKKRYWGANKYLNEKTVAKTNTVEFEISGPNVLKQKTYTCRKCEACYEDALDLQKHLMSHTLSVAFWKCAVCQEAFRSLDAYSKHVRNHVRLIPVFACNICATKFATQKELTSHVKTHVGRNFICGDCDTVFKTMDELTAHDETGECHRARKLKCPQCNLEFRKAQDLGQHLMADVCANSVVCSKCEKVFSSKDHLAKHECSAPRRLVCPKCTEVFKSEMEFAEHFLRNACSGVPKVKKVQPSTSRKPTRSSDLGSDSDCGFGMEQEDNFEEEDDVPLTRSTRKRGSGSDRGFEKLDHAPKAKKARTEPSTADSKEEQSEVTLKPRRGRPPKASSALGSAKQGDSVPKAKTSSALGSAKQRDSVPKAKASGALGNAKQRENLPKARKVPTETSGSDKVSQQLGDSSKKGFVCKHCGRNFKNRQNGMAHEPSCDALKPFGCDKCKRRFNTSNHLLKHRCKARKTIFDCKICGKQFRNPKSLRKHPCTRTYYRCDRCRRHFVTQRNFQHHLCCIKQVFRCQKCETQMQSEKLLRKHYDECDALVPAFITCPECLKGFPTKYLFRMHLEGKYCGREVFDCSKCGREFHREKTMLQHKCAVPKTFACTQCSAEYRYLVSARKHRCKPAKYQCQKCDARFDTKKASVTHEKSGCRFTKKYRKTNTGQLVHNRKTIEEVMEPKLSECVCCFYMFGTQKDLADHYCESFGADSDLKGRMCKAENWINCSKCNGNFSSKDEFREHYCAKTGRKKCPGCERYGLEKNVYKEDLWSCGFCGVDIYNFENFAANPSMDVKFECSTCLKSFDTTELLAQHDCTQLSCLACKEVFRSAEELEEHVSRCRMKCSSCKQVFATEDDLAGHVLGTDLNGCLGAYMPKKAGSK